MTERAGEPVLTAEEEARRWEASFPPVAVAMAKAIHEAMPHYLPWPDSLRPCPSWERHLPLTEAVIERPEWLALTPSQPVPSGLDEYRPTQRGALAPIDIDEIEMRWASQWNESDDGEVRAWRADVARLIDEVRMLRDRLGPDTCPAMGDYGPNGEPIRCGYPVSPPDGPMHRHSFADLLTPSQPVPSGLDEARLAEALRFGVAWTGVPQPDEWPAVASKVAAEYARLAT